jgi:sugar O-acyltransferase (sialic acid O-acetyltransferase NeuD family)
VADVILIGAGGHARVLASVLRKLRQAVLGYTAPTDQGLVLGSPWLGDDGVLERHDPKGVELAMGVGVMRPAPTRAGLVARLASFRFLTVISPDAIVNGGVTVGEGSVVFDGAVVQYNTRIGRLAILNTGCRVDHDCQIGDYVHIAPGATLCGDVTVCDGAMIGAGATLLPGCRIGSGVMVGAGAVVTGHCLAPGTYVGVPARKLP